MSRFQILSNSTATMALIVASAVLVTACGGGSSTPAAAPAPAGGVVGAPTASIPGGTLNGIPQTEATSGQVGACSSIKGGAPGFEIGLCSTSFSNSFASGSVVEGVFQNGPTSSAESAANVYDLSLPSAWGGPTITLKITAGDSTNVLGGGAIGNLVGGYSIDQTKPAVSPAANATSIVDFGTTLGAARLLNFGIFGRSKQEGELFIGGFAGPAPGAFIATNAQLTTGASSLTYNGSGVTNYVRTSTSPVPSGVSPSVPLSATVQVTFNKTTKLVTGTLSAFKLRQSSGLSDVAIQNLTFSGALDTTTGRFTGTSSGANTVMVKGMVLSGSLSGTGAEVVTGQFAGTASDGRLLSGAFGAKQ